MLLLSTNAPTTGSPVGLPKGAAPTFQAVGATSAGTGTATIIIEVSNDCANWLPHDTITLQLSTTIAQAGIEVGAGWNYVRGTIPPGGISGTDAAVSLHLGGVQ